MSRKRLGITCLLLSVALLGGTRTARAQAADKKPVNLRVLLPDAKATLTIDGNKTNATGATRQFVSPPLDPGVNYAYKLVVVWQPNNYTTITRTREVPVRAGQDIEVDLRQEDKKNPDEVLVRYVPTPQDVVDEMLKLGELREGDVVYDLGCGDGRIVITAVKKGAKRGVGVDIDPERIKDSKENARKEKVEDKVEFRQEDVLKIKDISDATLVMLYMGEELNLRLRPTLQKVLKPGTRIVSHRFTMGDWKPEKTITYTDTRGQTYKLHLWRIGEEKKDDKEDKKEEKKDDK
jgi:uncharacterized protein (TIGR03000 family)